MDSILRLGSFCMRPVFEGKGVVLMFHRILESKQRSLFDGLRGLEVLPSVYEDVLKHFQNRRFKFLSAAELSQSILTNDVPDKFIVITFDDGYIDNAEYVAGSMSKQRLPWTLYLSDGFCDRTLPCWWYGLAQVIEKESKIDASPVEGGRYAVSQASISEKNNIYGELRRTIHERWAQPEYQEKVSHWFKSYGIELLEITDNLAMTWEQARDLVAGGCDIGAHTKQHLNLKMCDSVLAQAEIFKSKTSLETMVNRPVTTFAYPYGDRDACGPREFLLAKLAGFDLAFTTWNGWIHPQHFATKWNLPRINISGTWDTLDKALFRVSGWSEFIESPLGRIVSQLR